MNEAGRAAEALAATHLERMPYRSALWVLGTPQQAAAVSWPTQGVLRARDRDGHLVALCEGPWVENLLVERNPRIDLVRVLDPTAVPAD